jgi:hypothetical protein
VGYFPQRQAWVNPDPARASRYVTRGYHVPTGRRRFESGHDKAKAYRPRTTPSREDVDGKEAGSRGNDHGTGAIPTGVGAADPGGGATEATRGLESDHLLDPTPRLLAGLDAGRVLAGPGAGRGNVGGRRGMNAAPQWSAAQRSALIDWSGRCCSPAFRNRAIPDGHRKAINGRV